MVGLVCQKMARLVRDGVPKIYSHRSRQLEEVAGELWPASARHLPHLVHRDVRASACFLTPNRAQSPLDVFRGAPPYCRG